jgi:hypothetical protein
LFDLNLFFTQAGLSDALDVFNEYHEDLGETNYPDPALISEHVAAFVHRSLKSDSVVTQGNRTLPWWEVFVLSFRELEHKSSKVLDRFADRDEVLVSLAERLENRASTLANTLTSCITHPSLTHLYDNGVPEIHLHEFTDFLLELIRTFRDTRDFGAGQAGS